MELPKIDFSQISYPLKTLLLGNEDTWGSMVAIVSDLTPEQLRYAHPNINQRSIAEMVNHALDTQYGFYTRKLVLCEDLPKPLYEGLPETAKDALQRISDTYLKVVELWKGIDQEKLSQEIKTEWGQTLTGELALFQSITHTHYHVSEIVFLRSLGGFSTSVMG